MNSTSDNNDVHLSALEISRNYDTVTDKNPAQENIASSTESSRYNFLYSPTTTFSQPYKYNVTLASSSTPQSLHSKPQAQETQQYGFHQINQLYPSQQLNIPQIGNQRPQQSIQYSNLGKYHPTAPQIGAPQSATSQLY